MKQSKKSIDIKVSKNQNDYDTVTSTIAKLTENYKSTHVRTKTNPTLVKIQKSEDNMKFDNSFRNKRIEIDENKIMNKFDSDRKNNESIFQRANNNTSHNYRKETNIPIQINDCKPESDHETVTVRDCKKIEYNKDENEMIICISNLEIGELDLSNLHNFTTQKNDIKPKLLTKSDINEINDRDAPKSNTFNKKLVFLTLFIVIVIAISCALLIFI